MKENVKISLKGIKSQTKKRMSKSIEKKLKIKKKASYSIVKGSQKEVKTMIKVKKFK